MIGMIFFIKKTCNKVNTKAKLNYYNSGNGRWSNIPEILSATKHCHARDTHHQIMEMARLKHLVNNSLPAQDRHSGSVVAYMVKYLLFPVHGRLITRVGELLLKRCFHTSLAKPHKRNYLMPLTGESFLN